VDYVPDAAWWRRGNCRARQAFLLLLRRPEAYLDWNFSPPSADETENPHLVKREIPIMREEIILAKRLEDSGR